jgi:hypothetical protein
MISPDRGEGMSRRIGCANSPNHRPWTLQRRVSLIQINAITSPRHPNVFPAISGTTVVVLRK